MMMFLDMQLFLLLLYQIHHHHFSRCRISDPKASEPHYFFSRNPNTTDLIDMPQTAFREPLRPAWLRRSVSPNTWRDVS
jgi:hypothetical protein